MTSQARSPRPGVYLGIDVGGTDVKIGLIDSQGNVLCSRRTATSELVTPAAVFEHALWYARQQHEWVDSSRPILAVGLAVPGVLDTATSTLREVVNLPGWLGVPLLESLQQSTGLPAAVINDANAAALAEHARRDLGDRSLALVTLGTGVGGGLVLSGRPHGGDHGCSGEIGHMAIEFGEHALPCTCGSRGHLETYAGVQGVLQRLHRRRIDAGVPVLADEAPWTTRKIADAAGQGDPHCLAVIQETAAYVGRAVGMLCQIADPQVVLLGGAMTFGGDATPVGRRFLDHVRDEVRGMTLVQVGTQVVIDFASLGNDAGMIGAAMAARS